VAEILDKRQFAARLGVADITVRQWIARGKLSGAALTEDGKVIVGIAEAQLKRHLNPTRGRPRGATKPGSFSERLQQQKLDEGAIRLRRLRREELAERGRYVLADGIERTFVRGYQQLVGAVESWLLYDLADLLSLSADGRATLRTAWHRFRTREAEAAQGRAAALPKYVPDSSEAEGEAGAAVRVREPDSAQVKGRNAARIGAVQKGKRTKQ
jgi:hypothetical protein